MSQGNCNNKDIADLKNFGTFGEFLKAKRSFRNWTQLQLAKKCGLSLYTIANIEHNRYINLRLVTIAKISKALNLDLYKFLEKIIELGLLNLSIKRLTQLGILILQKSVKLNYPLSTLGKKFNLDESGIYQYISGETLILHNNTAGKLSQFLEINVAQLQQITSQDRIKYSPDKAISKSGHLLGLKRTKTPKTLIGKIFFKKRMSLCLDQKEFAILLGIKSKYGSVLISTLENNNQHHSIRVILKYGGILGLNEKVLVAAFLIDHKGQGKYNIDKIKTRFGKLLLFELLRNTVGWHNYITIASKDMLSRYIHSDYLPQKDVIIRLAQKLNTRLSFFETLIILDEIDKEKGKLAKFRETFLENISPLTLEDVFTKTGLSIRQTEIIKLMWRGKTLKEIGVEFNLTRERIRQIKKDIFRKIDKYRSNVTAQKAVFLFLKIFAIIKFMKITFYGGLNEIGGNKILLEHKNTKVFLDFGKSFSRYSKFFEEYLQPRRINGIGDFLALDLIPKLSGLYRKDYLKMLAYYGDNLGLNLHRKPEFDAILISHAHADHINFLSFLDPEIPVYLIPETLKIVKVLDTLGQESLENEIYDFKERKTDGTLPKKKQEIKPKVVRNFVEINPYKKFKLKDLEIIFLPVEHSIPGCAMILISGDFGNILYSGDFRLGGPLKKENKTLKTLELLKKIKIDWFLCEGTRIKEENIIHENNVFKDTKKSIKDVKDLISIEYSFKDLTRFHTFLTLARELHKILVFPSEWFFYIKFLDHLGFDIPKNWKENVYFFARRKITFKGLWERELYQTEKKVYAKDIKENQKRFILGTSFYKITDLVDIAPNKNSIYIQSTSEPFNEEMQIDLTRLKNWLDVFNIKTLIKPHASGHISGTELANTVKSLDAKYLIPIHTENPKMFKSFHKNVINIKGNSIKLT